MFLPDQPSQPDFLTFFQAFCKLNLRQSRCDVFWSNIQIVDCNDILLMTEWFLMISFLNTATEWLGCDRVENSVGYSTRKQLQTGKT